VSHRTVRPYALPSIFRLNMVIYFLLFSISYVPVLSVHCHTHHNVLIKKQQTDDGEYLMAKSFKRGKRRHPKPFSPRTLEPSPNLCFGREPRQSERERERAHKARRKSLSPNNLHPPPPPSLKCFRRMQCCSKWATLATAHSVRVFAHQCKPGPVTSISLVYSY